MCVIFLFDPQAPEPAEPWEGVRDALSEGDVAAQNDIILGKGLTGSEDCLFLNIYTPKVRLHLNILSV